MSDLDVKVISLVSNFQYRDYDLRQLLTLPTREQIINRKSLKSQGGIPSSTQHQSKKSGKDFLIHRFTQK